MRNLTWLRKRPEAVLTRRRIKPGDALIRAGTVVLLVGLLAFAIYQCAKHVTVGIDTLRTQEMTDSSYTSLELCLFRDEQTVSTAGGHIVDYKVQDGEKVSAGTVLGQAYMAQGMDAASLQKQLNTYGERLDRLMKADKQGTLTDTDALKTKIDASYLDILSAANQGRLDVMTEAAGEMLADLDRYDLLSGRIDFSSTDAAALAAARNALLEGLTPAGSLTTDRAGWFYYDTDGFENAFPYEAALTMTPAQFRNMKDTATCDTSSQAGGKMVYNAVWYAAASVSLSDAACFLVGNNYTMFCGDSAASELSMTCVRVEADDEGALVVFQFLSMPASFASLRYLSAETVYHQISGYRIPSYALTTLTSPVTGDPVTGVYVLEGNIVVFRRVWVREARDEYVIAYTSEAASELCSTLDEAQQTAIQEDGWSFLTLNDRMITGGHGLHEGKILT